MVPVAAAVTRVLVTGFGPFAGVPNNPSFAITSLLPSILPNNIEIAIYPSAIPVAFHPTVDLLPTLYNNTKPDVVLHIGVAEGRKYFAVEAGSRRGNFDFSQDIENRNFTRAEGDAVWGDAPRRLDTDLDLNATVEKWQSRTKELAWPAILTRSMKNMGVEENGKVDVKVSHGLADFLAEESGENMAAASTDPDKVRWSDDVGTYLCGFIFYAGMVQKSTMVAADSRPSARVGKRDTAFMHVPLLKSEKEIALGVNVTIALVQSLVESWRAQKALE